MMPVWELPDLRHVLANQVILENRAQVTEVLTYRTEGMGKKTTILFICLFIYIYLFIYLFIYFNITGLQVLIFFLDWHSLLYVTLISI